MTDEQLLREYIRETLNEDIFIKGYGFDIMKVFVEPFADAAKVIKGEISKLSTRAIGAVGKLATGIAGLINPFYEAKFREIKNFEERRLREIESDPDYRKAWNEIKPHVTTGVKKMAFMFDPVGYITAELVTKSPAAALSISGMMLRDVKDAALIAVGRTVKSRTNVNDFEKTFKQLMSLREGPVDPEAAKTILQSEEMQKLLNSTDFAQKVQTTTAEIAQETATSMMEEVNAVLAANTFDELEQILGKTIDQSSLRGLEGEAAEVQAAALAQVKQEARKSAIKMMGNHLGDLGLSGKTSHPYHKIMGKAIKSLVPDS